MFRCAPATGVVLVVMVFAPASFGQSTVPAHDVSRPCEYCHQMPDGTSHPVGMKPSMAVPDDLPLDGAGRVTCATCHDVGRVGTAAFLRRSGSGASLCAECHARSRATGPSLEHALMIGSAHGGMDAAGRKGAAAASIDSRSLQCMGCHDGSIAESDNMHVGGGPSAPAGFGTGPSLGQTHPVGVDYARASSDHRELAPLSSLQRGAVRLIEGRVGCTSCHSPYSRRSSLLVVSNQGSALCTRCHRL